MLLNTQRGTVIGKNNVTVSTIEHGMAALYALGIDNCLIEVNASEFPILDGSSIEYVKAIKKAGIVEQEKDKDYYIVRKKIEVSDPETGSKLTLLPDDSFCINSFIEFDSQYILISRPTMIIDRLLKQILHLHHICFVRENTKLREAVYKGGNLITLL